jgi:hypothetical protein
MPFPPFPKGCVKWKRAPERTVLVTKTFPNVYSAHEPQLVFDKLFQQGVTATGF